MSVSGPTPDRPTYEADFRRSVDIFEKSFKNIQDSKFDAQKAQYVKVMHESLRAMQESASGMVNDKLREMKNNLSHDLDDYISSPTDDHKVKVEKDINQMKRAV